MIVLAIFIFFNINKMENNNLKIGNMAPDFTASAYFNNTLNNQISLSDFRGKWVWLFFYPLDFTFVCPTELYALGKMREEFAKNNCQIVGVSVDSVYAHQAWAEKDQRIKDLGFPLLSDITRQISMDYQVLHTDGMSLRGAFLIDGDGVLQSIVVNNLNVGRSPQELLRLLKAYQTGDLCPVNWQEGQATLGKAE